MTLARNRQGDYVRWAQAWQNTLPGDNPLGQDISFETEFEQLREEAEKSFSLHQGTTDWELVLQMATALLERRSKDVWVFCYGVRASYECHGLEGTALGLSILNDYLENYWETLYPPAGRPLRRAAPLNWLAGRFEHLFCSGGFPFEHYEHSERFRHELIRLQAVLDARLGESAPSFGKVLHAVPQPPPPAPKEAETAPLADAQAPRPSSPLPSPPPAAIPADLLTALDGDGRVPDSILPKLLRTTQEQCQQLAVHYLSRDATDWRAYFLHRAAVWTTVLQLPVASAEGITQLRPLPPDKALAFAAAVNSGQHASALPQLERSAGKAPFWFDGHRLVCVALEHLEAFQALDAVCVPLINLLERFPRLVECKFHDGSPFASQETLHWLEGLQGKSLGPKSLSAPWAAEEESEAQEGINRESLLHEAITLAAQEGFEAGLAHLGDVPATRSRESIVKGLLVARYCLETGRRKNGQLLLQSLYERLETWGLLDWEPKLGAKVITLLISAGKAKKGEKFESLVRTLHWLDPQTACSTLAETNL